MPGDVRPDARRPILGRKALEWLRKMLEIPAEMEMAWERRNINMEVLVPGRRMRLRMRLGPISGPRPVHPAAEETLWSHVKAVATTGTSVSIIDENRVVENDQAIWTAILGLPTPQAGADDRLSSYLADTRHELDTYRRGLPEDLRHAIRRIQFEPIG